MVAFEESPIFGRAPEWAILMVCATGGLASIHICPSLNASQIALSSKKQCASGARFPECNVQPEGGVGRLSMAV